MTPCGTVIGCVMAISSLVSWHIAQGGDLFELVGLSSGNAPPRI